MVSTSSLWLEPLSAWLASAVAEIAEALIIVGLLAGLFKGAAVLGFGSELVDLKLEPEYVTCERLTAGGR